jgi:hypothetical protein
VRPTEGTPLASGNLTRSGTASVIGMSTNANLGTLREVAGGTCILAIETQPSATATVGIPFAQQPVVLVWDQFGNLRSAANGATTETVVTAMRLGGSGTLLGTTNRTSVNGVVSFTDLALDVAADIRVRFSVGGAMAISDVISVNDAAAAGGSGGQSGSGEEPSTNAQPATLVGIQAFPNAIKIIFTGSADRTYRIQRATVLQGNGWTDIGSATTDVVGVGAFTDASAPGAYGFYRAVSAQ